MTAREASTDMTVIEYCTEEVRRQGHDVTTLDGIERVGWILNAWSYALACATHSSFALTMHDALNIGKLVEPHKNKLGSRQCGVRVGSRACPIATEVRPRLNSLFRKRDKLTPLEFYKEFELIHPFVDGNGRTGKVLLNWLNGTLLAPIFPPHDLFGGWIANP